MRFLSTLVSLFFFGCIAVAVVAFLVIMHYSIGLPDYRQLEDYRPPITTRLYAQDGSLLAEYATQKRSFVPVEKIPDLLKQAFISAEDKNFYTHGGIDFTGIARKDKRIKVFTHPNCGVTRTRNELLDKVSDDTDAIFYLDTDDMIHPKTLETLAYYMKKYKADVVECCLDRMEHSTVLPEYQEIKYPRKDIKVLDDMSIFWSNKTRIGSWINIWNKLYRWDKVKHLRFSEKLAYEEDYFYGCLVHDTISRKILIPDVLYYYRKNPTSVNGKLNFERYVRTTANRIQLSFDTFLKTGKVPPKYRSDFEYDLANDCYRMVIRKNLKKNKNFKNCRKIFELTAYYINNFYDNNTVDFKRLNFIKRWMVFLTRHHQFILAKLLVQFT